MPAREDEWRDEEQVLGLYVYLCHRHQRLGREHPAVLALSDTLRRLAQHQGRVISEEFRNPSGMAMQLGKFLNLEDPPTIKGLGQPSWWHREIWARYANDESGLQRRIDEITGTFPGAPRLPSLPSSSPVEASERYGRRPRIGREELFDAFGPERPEQRRVPAAPIELNTRAQDRADQVHDELRMQLQRFLVRYGFEAHNSRKARAAGGEVIRFDLAATRGPLTLLVEVKSLPEGGDDREPLRKGLGQLVWYRSRWRRIVAEPCVAVLCVERRPVQAEEWLAACSDVAVVLTWPERFEAVLAECDAIAQLSASRSS